MGEKVNLWKTTENSDLSKLGLKIKFFQTEGWQPGYLVAKN